MLKTIVLSCWGALVTIGAVYANFQLSKDTPEVTIEQVSMEEHTTDTLTVAIFHNGKVIGHLATRIKYQFPADKETDGPVPINVMIEDGLYEVIYQMKVSRLRKLGDKDLSKIGDMLVTLLNERKTPLPIANAMLEETQLLLN